MLLHQGVISPDYTVLEIIGNANAKFLEYILKSTKIRFELRVRCKGIVEGFWRLYTDDLYTLQIPTPPIEEQDAILLEIDKRSEIIDQTISKAEKEIEIIQEYRTRLVSDVVTGKLDVRSIDIPDFEAVDADSDLSDEDEDSEDMDDLAGDEE